MIKYAELVLYDENDNTAGFELSEMQLKAVCKILGIKPSEQPGSISCFSDNSINKIIEQLENIIILKD